MTEASRNQALVSLKSLLATGDYYDLIITCGEDAYKVHKAVVCTRASFFARAIKFGGKETEENKIDLPEDDPTIVKLLVQYLYEGNYGLCSNVGHLNAAGFCEPASIVTCTEKYDPRSGVYYLYKFPHTCNGQGQYCDERGMCPHHRCGENCRYRCSNFICDKCITPGVCGTAEQLVTHATMYATADKYDVIGLKELSCDKFNRACAAYWNQPQFVVAADIAFSTTMEDDASLRNIVSSTIANHMKLIHKPKIKKLMRKHNGLALGIMEQKAEEHGWGKD